MKIDYFDFRLVERYLVDGFTPQRLSTYALNLFRHRMTVSEEKVLIGNWLIEHGAFSC